MGTKYYMINKRIKEIIEEEYKDDERVKEEFIDRNSIDLGKSSAGWKFLLIPNNIMADCWKAWKWTLRSGTYIVYDEYNREIPIEDFINMVESKQNGMGHDFVNEDDYGYEFSQF